MNDSSSSSSLVPQGMLPAFLAQAFADVYQEDGLVILGRGMGSLSLLASFVRFYADANDGHAALVQEEEEEEEEESAAEKVKTTSSIVTKKKPPLVIVMGLNLAKDASGEKDALLAILESWGTPADMLPTVLTSTNSSHDSNSNNDSSSSSSAKDRQVFYQRGGVLCVSSRILIVDLLSNVLDAKQIDGFLVYHAEKVSEQSTEAFILRIYYNSKRNNGFVKAFSNQPEVLVHRGGFGAVDKTLKACHVRRLHLYPRFHYLVRDELETRQAPAVTELHQPLSALQQRMQASILVAMKQCLEHLKSKTPLIEWNHEEVNMDNCLHLDKSLSRQMASEWHRVAPQLKQYVQDLRMLQTLLTALIQYDCISFWNLLANLKTTSAKTKYPSLWLLTRAGHDLFQAAKQRVYTIEKDKQHHTAANAAAIPKPGVARLIPVLEANPKWKLLQQVLGEIQQDYNNQKKNGTSTVGPVHVLVMVQDDKTLQAVKSFLVHGASRTLLLRWLRYLEGVNDRTRSRADASMGLPEEDRLVLEEEGRVRNILFGQGRRQNNKSSNKTNKTNSKKQTASSAPANNKRLLNQVPDYIKKRRRIAAEKGRGEQTHQADDQRRDAVLDEAVEATEHELKAAAREWDNDLQEEQHQEDEVDAEDSTLNEEDAMFRVTYSNELRVVLKSYSSIEGDEASLLLQEIRPQYIVLFDSDVAFVRSLEIYSSLRCCCCSDDPDTGTDPAVRVYHLVFEASAEEKSFKKALEREQNAFERLIQHKKVMPAPALHFAHGPHMTQEMQLALQEGTAEGSYMGGTQPLAFDTTTRQGRGKMDRSKERRDIAVDVREFRSALPSILHQGGMRLAPVTLTVGDFVLSSVHCVERKSISDLFGSFASGRLYTQAESMCKHYKCPILLIEFDPQKSFCLQNANDIGSTIRTDSVCSKMALLTMHFPKLRILWSHGPHETLKIFRDLKANHDEVDVERAIEIGRNESVEALLETAASDGKNNGEEAQCEEDEINETARDMLLRLPGVNVHSARRIMQECDSLAELSELSRDELRRITGPVTGQKLFTFFRQKLDAT